MSTKIYNGYILPKEYNDLSKLITFCKEFKLEIDLLKEKLYYQLFAKTMIDFIDKNLCGFTDFDKISDLYRSNNFFKVTNYFIQNRIKTRKEFERDPGYDFKFEVIFFPMSDKVLCMTFEDETEFKKLWDNHVEEYHYQNQTDKPVDISDENWKVRYEDWNKVLGGDGWGRPIDNGLLFTFSNKEIDAKLEYNLDINKVLEYIPSFEKRVYNKAKVLFLQEYINANKPENTKYDAGTFWKGIELIKSNSPEFIGYKEKVEKLLKPFKNITKEIILLPYDRKLTK